MSNINKNFHLSISSANLVIGRLRSSHNSKRQVYTTQSNNVYSDDYQPRASTACGSADRIIKPKSFERMQFEKIQQFGEKQCLQYQQSMQEVMRFNEKFKLSPKNSGQKSPINKSVTREKIERYSRVKSQQKNRQRFSNLNRKIISNQVSRNNVINIEKEKPSKVKTQVIIDEQKMNIFESKINTIESNFNPQASLKSVKFLPKVRDSKILLEKWSYNKKKSIPVKKVLTAKIYHQIQQSMIDDKRSRSVTPSKSMTRSSKKLTHIAPKAAFCESRNSTQYGVSVETTRQNFSSQKTFLGLQKLNPITVEDDDGEEAHIKIQNATRDIKQLQYTMRQIVCPQEQMHTELEPNGVKKISLIQNASILFKAKVYPQTMKLIFDYELQGSSNIDVYLSFTNKVPSIENNIFTANNPSVIDIIKPVNPGYKYLYLSIVSSESDAEISLKLYLKNKVIKNEQQKFQNSEQEFKKKVLQKVALFLGDEQKYQEFKAQLDLIKQKRDSPQRPDSSFFITEPSPIKKEYQKPRHLEVENRRQQLELSTYKKNVFLLMRRTILKNFRIQEDHRNYMINLARKRAVYWIKFVKIQQALNNAIGNFRELTRRIFYKKWQKMCVRRIEGRYLAAMKRRKLTYLGRRRQEIKQCLNIITFLKHDQTSQNSALILYDLLKESGELEKIKDKMIIFCKKIIFAQTVHKKSLESRATRLEVINQTWKKFMQEKVGAAMKLNQKQTKNKEKLKAVMALQNDVNVQKSILQSYYQMVVLAYKIKDIFYCMKECNDIDEKLDQYERKLQKWLNQYEQTVIHLGIYQPLKRKSKSKGKDKSSIEDVSSFDEKILKLNIMSEKEIIQYSNKQYHQLINNQIFGAKVQFQWIPNVNTMQKMWDHALNSNKKKE